MTQKASYVVPQHRVAKRFSRWVRCGLVAALAGCVPVGAPSTINDSEPTVAEQTTPKAITPLAQGDADVHGLTPSQIDAMFEAAFAQEHPFEDHRAVCLTMVRAESGGWPRNPPARALANFATLTNLPVLPGSQCSFEVFPKVIQSGDKAMLYSIRIEAIAQDGTATFTGSAIFGNLGSKGTEYLLKRRGERWYAEPTGNTVVS